MPLGNSITEGYTDGSLTNGQLRSYRYGLKYLLKNNGYKIDFVGSQTGGCDYFNDCQHAGIGGTRDHYLLDLLTSGYDTRNGIQILVPPRPYLDEYTPDIILLHIGTNDITHEGDAAITNQKITNILDLIDQYETRANKEVIVFLALIINRSKPWLPGSAALKTSNFNNGIKSLAQSRIALGDKIVIVDMENDAGFEYSNIDLMPDGLHPNELGYSKMSTLWASSIITNYNRAPIIAPIPDQIFEEDGSSSEICLDAYVSDYEDPDNQITWTFTQLITSNLDISLNANHQLVATSRETDWYGSQKVVFTATDMGKNGTYRKSVMDTIVFNVTPVDDAPVITSSPVLEARVSELYSYTLTATDVDNDVIMFSTVSEIPSWLTFSEISGKLTGTPESVNQGQSQLVLRVSDGSLFTDQNITITVNSSNALNDSKNVGLHFYPVPASTYLIVELDNHTGEIFLELLNASGVILHKALLPSGQNFYKVDLNNAENGIYFLHVFNQTKCLKGKFTVLK